MNKTFHSLVDETKNLLDEVKSFIRNDPPPSGTMVNLALGSAYIRLSGFCERAHEALILEYTKSSCPRDISNYCASTIARETNLNARKICDLWARFGEERHQAIKDHAEMQESGKWKSAFDQVYRVRNSQAHGHKQTASVTDLGNHFNAMTDYFEFMRQTLLK